MSRLIEDLIGVPWTELNCHALTTAACARFGRRVPDLGEDIECELVELGDEQPGDCVLTGSADAVTGVAAVVAPGMLLHTSETSQHSRCVRIRWVTGIVEIRRPPEC